jgi:hypothetical protein
MGRDQGVTYEIDQADGSPFDLSGKTVTAQLEHGGGTLALGVIIVDAPQGKFRVTITIAQLAAIGVNQACTIWVSVWNSDGTLADHVGDAAITGY